MVRLADPVAINRDDSAPDSQIGETAEVLERRIQAEYDEALEQERSGNKAGAQVSMTGTKPLTRPCLLSLWSTENIARPRPCSSSCWQSLLCKILPMGQSRPWHMQDTLC